MKAQKILKTIKVSEMIPYERNNKKHEKNVNEIVKSIQRNQYITPIIIDENNVVLAWHGRLLALQKLQIEEIEVIVVSWLSEDQKRDFRLSDNRIAELSERDYDNIKLELEELCIYELDELFVWVVPIEEDDDIDFDDIGGDNDKLPTDKSKKVVCPACDHEFIYNPEQ